MREILLTKSFNNKTSRTAKTFDLEEYKGAFEPEEYAIIYLIYKLRAEDKGKGVRISNREMREKYLQDWSLYQIKKLIRVLEEAGFLRSSKPGNKWGKFDKTKHYKIVQEEIQKRKITEMRGLK